MTDTVSLFEAKAHLSDLVRQVAETGQSMIISVRGKPKVRLVPYDAPPARPDAWDVREKLVAEYGAPGFEEPPRAMVDHAPLFDEADRQ